MTTSASIYINNIKVDFPKIGQDNDSQGFRDNFLNIQQALSATDRVLTTVTNNVALVSKSSNNFDYNTIKNANLQAYGVNVYDDFVNNGIRSQAGQIDYSNGNYQKIHIAGGTTTLSIVNWPDKSGGATGGILTLSVTPTTTNSVLSVYGDVNPVGDTTFPFTFDSLQPAFFELWTDDGGTTIYINHLGYKNGVVASGVVINAYETLSIGTNKYIANTGTNLKTIVSSTVTNQSGVLAVLPDVYSTTISNTTGYSLGELTSSTFRVVTSVFERIFEGATFKFPRDPDSEIYTVESYNNGKVVTTATFSTSILQAGDALYFKNPEFEDQEIVVTYKTTAVTTSTGSLDDRKGQIYSDGDSLWVAHENYGDVTNNWIQIPGIDTINASLNGITAARQLADGTSAVTKAVTTNTTAVATTEFVHNILPKGVILMWSGVSSSIPTGWALCDGGTHEGVETPNLVERFIVGAGSAKYGYGGISGVGDPGLGGRADAVLVTHNHAATSSVTDPGHDHSSGSFQYLLKPPYSGSLTGSDYTGSGSEQAVGPGDGGFMSSAATGISVSTTLGDSGTSTASTNTDNLPPFYALCYIIKVTGD